MSARRQFDDRKRSVVPHGHDNRVRDLNVLTKGQIPDFFHSEHAAQNMKQITEKELYLSNMTITAEYKKRLNESRTLRDKLHQCVGVVENEMGMLRGLRESGLAVMSELQRPLKLTSAWLNTRSTLPSVNMSPRSKHANSTVNPVDRALRQGEYELRGTVDSVASSLQALEVMEQKLKGVKATLEKEIESKNATIAIDRVCMIGGLDGADSNDHLASVLSRPSMQSHGMHTENEWKNATMVALSVANSSVSESKHVRTTVSQNLKSIESSGKLGKPSCVIDALRNRIKHNSQSAEALRLNTKMVQGELAQLTGLKESLLDMLDRTKRQLQTAMKRIELRIVKPSSECVRSGVEETLEIEIVKLQNQESDLQKQLQEMEGKRTRCARLIAQMEEELKQVSVELDADTRCADMQLPPVPPLNSPRTMLTRN